MAAPLIPQGVMNRALTAVTVIDSPELNATMGYFSDKMARISFDGATTDYIPTATGAVPSPRFYQIGTITMYLVQSQALAAAWEQRRLTNSVLDDVNFVTASPTMPDYYLYNCILENIAEVDGSGGTVDLAITVRGTYYINGDLFQ